MLSLLHTALFGQSFSFLYLFELFHLHILVSFSHCSPIMPEDYLIRSNQQTYQKTMIERILYTKLSA